MRPISPTIIATGLIAYLFAATTTLTQARENFSYGGFASFGYLESSQYNFLANTSEGTFEFAELGLNFNWNPLNQLAVVGQLFAFELGPYGNYDPLIDYLHVDYTFSKEFGLRLGRVKRPLGLYNDIQDIDIARTAVLLPNFYDPRFRDYSAAVDGAAIYGSFDTGGKSRIDYTFYGGHRDVEEDGGIAGLAITTTSEVLLDAEMLGTSSTLAYGGQVWFFPGPNGLRLGVGHLVLPDFSYTIAATIPPLFPDPLLAGQRVLFEYENVNLDLSILSFEYFWKDYTLTGEYWTATNELSATQFLGPLAISTEQERDSNDAWALSAAKRWNSLELAFTYTDFPRKGIDRQLSLRYDLTEFWTLKVERHDIEGTISLFNQFGQNPVRDEQNWTLWAAKSTFHF